MAMLSCFPVLIGKKKKVDEESEYDTGNYETLEIALEQPENSFKAQPTRDMDDSDIIVKSMDCKILISSDLAVEAHYEGEDKQEEVQSMRRDLSNFDLQALDMHMAQDDSPLTDAEMIDMAVKRDQMLETYANLAQSRHMSDPGMRNVEIWASTMLKRSCSNLEIRMVMKMLGRLPLPNSLSPQKQKKTEDSIGSPAASMMTRFSADKVILKKHSSSQVLPSRSRRLWWKLFLWSHRNTHCPSTVKQPEVNPAAASLKQPGGYSSDTVERNWPQKAVSAAKSKGKAKIECVDFDENQDWPLNQWVAFSTPSSSFSRVDEWVKDLDHAESLHGADEQQEISNEAVDYPPSPEMSISHARDTAYSHQCRNTNLSEEMLHANYVIQSLNSSSTVAHISGMGLKVVPNMSAFVSLRSVNLSSNSIVRIPPGSLPKGLHALNLSKNKISTIEGLRELTRLRVLDLSYNRISRIGHGLSSCALIRELFLAGNKISDVEGLHRLLKLTVLDLSFNFNKITITKCLGQLVANYNSMQVLNLLGNPIQSNISEEQLRKAVCSLLPKLAYLNKQLIKQQRAREVLTESVAKAALGSGGGGRGSHRRSRRGSQSGSGGSRVGPGGGSTSHRSQKKPKGQGQLSDRRMESSKPSTSGR